MSTVQQHPVPIDAVIGRLTMDGAARVELEIVPAEPGEALEDAEDIVRVFRSAVANGLLPASARAERPSSIALEREGTETLRYVGACESVHPGAWRLLLASLCQSHYAHAALRGVRLRVEPAAGGALHADTLFAWPLPERRTRVPFPVDELETFSGSSEPLVRLEFARALTDDEFDRLSEAITSWESLILLGGYNDSCERREDLPYTPGELYRASPRVVEDTMFGFDVRPEAFHPLINLAAHFHETVAPVARLELV